MKRIGIVEVDTRTELLVRVIFKAMPDAQVFLSIGSGETAQRLAREYPCWTLDSHQAVVDEADIIFTNTNRHALVELARCIRLRRTQTLISLAAGIQLRELQQLFNHADCVRLLLATVNESGEPTAILTTVNEEIINLFSLSGSVSMISNESDFNMIEMHQ